MRAVAAILLLMPAVAAAHGGSDAAAPGWGFDPWVTALLVLSGGAYLLGVARLWRRAGVGRGIPAAAAAGYAAGWLVLSAALLSPLHGWGERVFTAHMIEHELIMAVAAPLLVLGWPGRASAWALPRAVSRGLARLGRLGPLRAAWRGLSAPLVATILHGIAIWVWHAPALFEGAVGSIGLHRLQHLCFLLTALLFWWSLLRRAEPGAAALHLFFTMTHTGLLGALLTFAPRGFYAAQTGGSFLWGLTPLEDQQLAGLVMWIPAGTVYAGAALMAVGTWIREAGRRAERADALGGT